MVTMINATAIVETSAPTGATARSAWPTSRKRAMRSFDRHPWTPAKVVGPRCTDVHCAGVRIVLVFWCFECVVHALLDL